MGMVIFTIGGIFGIFGLVALLIECRICLQIVRATVDKPDGLKKTEIWLNTLQFRKIRKLRTMASSPDENIEIQQMARKALKLSMLYYCFIVICMGLMFIGLSML